MDFPGQFQAFLTVLGFSASLKSVRKERRGNHPPDSRIVVHDQGRFAYAVLLDINVDLHGASRLAARLGGSQSKLRRAFLPDLPGETLSKKHCRECCARP